MQSARRMDAEDRTTVDARVCSLGRWMVMMKLEMRDRC